MAPPSIISTSVFISPSTVEGDISADEVVVYGSVVGNIKANRIEIKKGSTVDGDIKTEVLIIEGGAIYNGRCSMGSEGMNNYPEGESSD
jgi:cytoskeletal protein CcmA (bactofilin family)